MRKFPAAVFPPALSSAPILLAPAFLSLFLSLVSPALADNAPSRESWIGQMVVVMPGVVCAEGQYFRKCFNLDRIGCNSEAESAVKVCAARYATEMPTALSPKDGQQWGSKISECAYDVFESNLQKAGKKVDSDDCKDPAKWQ
ncbi:hypothetical protein [Candidatus Magnetominusculus dajiuhuensis]|uniref:hypothetical protein n=1 Tax=Candidatus Magnetominusculus dajiuhuensis TaxID=3137712 RepID=UPI003B429B37